MIDNKAKGCGECDFDKWGNLVLCPKCEKNSRQVVSGIQSALLPTGALTADTIKEETD
jgi:hypothetical protein